jgi:hypothetical protein
LAILPGNGDLIAADERWRNDRHDMAAGGRRPAAAQCHLPIA